jgi:hypothetical protein
MVVIVDGKEEIRAIDHFRVQGHPVVSAVAVPVLDRGEGVTEVLGGPPIIFRRNR